MTAKSFLPIIALSLFVFRSAAQSASPDTLPHTDAMAQVTDNYHKVMDGQSEFYTGPGYTMLPQAIKGSPYFDATPELQTAIIRYKGILYKDVPILYDLYQDLMVSRSQNVLYSFRKEYLDDVYLPGHHFIYLSNQRLNLAQGYYDQLYSGRSEVLLKTTCSIIKRAGQQTVEITYETSKAIYIKKGAGYVAVYSKGSVLKVFADKEKQLKQYLSDNKIAYRKDREGSIVKLAAYYDQISK
jgi:hypothetical protein